MPSDLEAARSLAVRVDRPLGSYTADLAWDPDVLGSLDEVEALHENINVSIGPHALEEMLLATLEGYSVPKNKKTKFTEVFGLCLGTVRDEVSSKRGVGRHRSRYVYIERAPA